VHQHKQKVKQHELKGKVILFFVYVLIFFYTKSFLFDTFVMVLVFL